MRHTFGPARRTRRRFLAVAAGRVGCHCVRSRADTLEAAVARTARGQDRRARGIHPTAHQRNGPDEPDGNGDRGPSAHRRHHPQPPQPTVYPPHTQLATFRANLARTLDADKPFLIAVDPVEIAEPAPDLAELDETDGRMGSAHTHELLERAHHLLFGLGPLALTLQGPRPVHTTQSGEDGERVPFRPARGGVGPLEGASVIADFLACADEAAVHLASGGGTEATFDGEEPRFVEVLEPDAQLALVDQGPAEPGSR